jgi:mRNA interferase RelE/StbE
VSGQAPPYVLRFRPAALRSLRKLDAQVARRIKAAAEDLAKDPRPAGAIMLTGMHGVWRVKVAKDYRILYTIDDAQRIVRVADAGHRSKIYEQ